MNLGFESFVNSEECKTEMSVTTIRPSLRALLIQKSVKQSSEALYRDSCLRALLIQKSVKRTCWDCSFGAGLRALLIQKSVKHRN